MLKLKSDAYGHGVNLAFRLCDRAGREKKMGHDKMGPYVLLDRRIGQLLINEVPNTTKKGYMPFVMQTFDGYSPARFAFDKPLKGIDELWCYALEEPEALKVPGESLGQEISESGPTEESGEVT